MRLMFFSVATRKTFYQLSVITTQSVSTPSKANWENCRDVLLPRSNGEVIASFKQTFIAYINACATHLATLFMKFTYFQNATYPQGLHEILSS